MFIKEWSMRVFGISMLSAVFVFMGINTAAATAIRYEWDGIGLWEGRFEMVSYFEFESNAVANGQIGLNDVIDFCWYVEATPPYTSDFLHVYTLADLQEKTDLSIVLSADRETIENVDIHWYNEWEDENGYLLYDCLDIHESVIDAIYGIRMSYGLQEWDGSWQRISPTPTPEPTTMLLFGTGLAGFAVTRIRRKKN